MPSVMRDLSVHQEHELLLKLEAAGLDSGLASGVINSKDNRQAKQVIAFLKNGCKQKVMEFLAYICSVEIAPVEEFTVGDFYKMYQEIPMGFGYNFEAWILYEMKNMKLSLRDKTLLHKFLVKKDGYDANFRSDFVVESPVIPVKKFMVQLKAMLESQPKGETKENGLYSPGVNFFYVDLEEIGHPTKGHHGVNVVEVYWRTNYNRWEIDVQPPGLSGTVRYCGFSPTMD